MGFLQIEFDFEREYRNMLQYLITCKEAFVTAPFFSLNCFLLIIINSSAHGRKMQHLKALFDHLLYLNIEN